VAEHDDTGILARQPRDLIGDILAHTAEPAIFDIERGTAGHLGALGHDNDRKF